MAGRQQGVVTDPLPPRSGESACDRRPKSAGSELRAIGDLVRPGVHINAVPKSVKRVKSLRDHEWPCRAVYKHRAKQRTTFGMSASWLSRDT